MAQSKELSEKKRSYSITISTYLDDGRVFHYEISGTDAAELAGKGREHAAAIIKGGYRHNNGTDWFEHYGPHRIDKVKVTGLPISTRYPDQVSGT